MKSLMSTLALALVLAGATAATAQKYPARPITMIVPFAAGGPADVSARIVGEHMSRTLGQQIVIENVLGAGGTTGSARAMRASPDGYTIALGQVGTHAAAVAFYPNLAYRPEADFAPIGRVVDQAVLVVARKDFPARNVGEFFAYLKANAGKLNMAHAGVGSISHFSCLLFNAALGAKPTLVPFSGGAPAINAMVGGQVDYMCEPISDIVPAGAVRHHEGLYERRVGAKSGFAGCPHRQGKRLAAIRGLGLVCAVRAQKHTRAGSRYADRGARQSARRRYGAQAPRRPRLLASGQARTRPGGACRFGQNRSRALGANHTGGQYQGVDQRKTAVNARLNGGAGDALGTQCADDVVQHKPPGRTFNLASENGSGNVVQDGRHTTT